MLTRRIDIEVRTLNPVLAYGAERYVSQYLFTPLIYLDHDGRPVPGIAEHWSVRDGGRTFRFELNRSATFSDGRSVTASDVEFTLKKVADPKSLSPLGDSFLHLDSINVVNDHTIDIAFKYALATQLTRFAEVYIVPAHVYNRSDFLESFHATAVGSGPYTLRTFQPSNRVILERRADYWSTRPHIQTVIFQVLNDNRTAWNALQRGDIDETTLASETWKRSHGSTIFNRSIRFERFPSRSYNYIAWNARRTVFSDRQVRRALSMCIPTEQVIASVYADTARAVTGPYPFGDDAQNPVVRPISYDPRMAARVLAATGWADRNGDGVLDKDGTSLSFTLEVLSGDSATTNFFHILQSELRAVGVVVEPATMDPAAVIARIREGNYDAAYLAIDLDTTQDLFDTFHSSQFAPKGGNIAFYASPQADHLMEQARTEFDASKRRQLLWQLHALLAADQPYTWVVQPDAKWGFKRRVKGIAISPTHGLFLWYPGELDWWIDDGPR